VNGADALEGVQLRDGFWGWERDEITVKGRFAWTSADAALLAPLPKGDEHQAEIEVRLSCGEGPVTAVVTVEGTATSVGVAVAPAWFPVGTVGHARHLVNNAGMILLPDGATADRGFLELDTDQYNEPAEVFGWSAAAVLLSQRFIREVGPFDSRFFLYYEDADFSWRGRLLGWHYRYVPASIVWHEHSATVGEGSSLAHHLLARNRLLMLTKNAPAVMVGRALLTLSRDLAAAVWRDLVRRPMSLKRPAPAHAAKLARVLLGYLQLAPGAVAARRRLRRRASVHDADVLRWAVAEQELSRLRLGPKSSSK
jgi:hypothetical protein